MKAKLRPGARSVAYTWLISYLSVLLIPIVIGLVIYNRTACVISDQINHSNRVLLQQVQQIVDSRMNEINRLSTQIRFDTNLQLLVESKETLDSSHRFAIWKLINDYGLLKNANDFIDDFMIYLNNQNAMITTTSFYSSSILHSSAIQKTDLNYAKLANMLENLTGPAISVYEGDTRSFIIYSVPVISTVTFRPAATLLFFIDDSSLLRDTQGIDLVENGAVAVVDSGNRVLAATQDIGLLPSLRYEDFAGDEGIQTLNEQGEKLAVSYRASGVMDWIYLSVVPMDVYAQTANATRNMTLISLAASAVLGAIVSALFTRKNYGPLRQLIRKLSHPVKTRNTACNEYRFIEDAVDEAMRYREQTESILRKQNRVICSSLITRLLEGRIDDSEPAEDMLASYDIKFPSDRFAVMAVYIEEADGRILDEDLSLIRFVIRNAGEELIRRAHVGFVVEHEEILACLVSLRGECGSDALAAVATELADFMREEFGVRVSLAISCVHNGLPGIHAAYEEAVEAMGYRMLIGKGKIIRYEDITGYKSETTRYSYPIETEQQLINCIRAGDTEKTRQLFDRIFEENFGNGRLSLTLARCLIFDLVGTLLKALNDVGCSGSDFQADGLRPVDRILGCATLTEMRREMNDILTAVCGTVQKEHGGMRVVREVIAYVQEHYRETELSVSQIADAFNMNMSYISRQFKRMTGEGLYDYINKIRVESAKKLLLESDENLADIARQIGYYTDNSFIRVFKRYEGVTPGQYKKAAALGQTTLILEKTSDDQRKKNDD